MPPPPLDQASIAKQEKAYAAAKKRWRETRANDAMEAMAAAACRMDDGAKARAAYRKVRGRDPRRRVFWTCRAAGVSLKHGEPGYSQDELIRRAGRKLEAGDAKTALEWAREANNKGRSDAAILILGKAYCALGRVARARKMLWHVNRGRKEELIAACRKHGHDIGPESESE